VVEFGLIFIGEL